MAGNSNDSFTTGRSSSVSYSTSSIPLRVGVTTQGSTPVVYCACVNATQSPLLANVTNATSPTPAENQALYYVGLGLALGNCLFVGTSYVLQKKALNRYQSRTGRTGRDTGLGYLGEWLWWVGLIMMATGEIANFLAFGFAPASLVTPLEGLTVVVSVVLARIFLSESLNVYGQIGIFLCLVGSVNIVLMSPEEKDITTMDNLVRMVTSPAVIALGCILVSLMIICGAWLGPRYGDRNPFIFLAIASAAGPITVFGCKAIGLAISDTLGGVNQFTHWLTWVMIVLTVVCVLVQLYYVNRTLASFSTCVVTPVYFVMFTSFVLIASGIAFSEFANVPPDRAIVMVCGFLVIAAGVILINIFKSEECSWSKVVHLLKSSNEPQVMDEDDGDSRFSASITNLEMTNSVTTGGVTGATPQNNGRSRWKKRKTTATAPFRRLAAAANSSNKRKLTEDEYDDEADNYPATEQPVTVAARVEQPTPTVDSGLRQDSFAAPSSTPTDEWPSRRSGEKKRERRAKSSSQENVVADDSEDDASDIQHDTDRQWPNLRNAAKNGLAVVRSLRKIPSDFDYQPTEVAANHRTASGGDWKAQHATYDDDTHRGPLVGSASDGSNGSSVCVSVPTLNGNGNGNGNGKGHMRSPLRAINTGTIMTTGANPHENLVYVDLDLSSSQPC